MNLNLVTNLFNHFTENTFMKNFINELSNYLENNQKNNLSFRNEKTPIIEDIVASNNITTGNENSIRWKEDDTIIAYVQKTNNDKPMYFVKDSKKTYWLNNEKHFNDNVYTVLKVQSHQIEEIEISKKDMPKEIEVNNVFRIENNTYIIDTIATKELQEEIKNMAKEIINKQDINLAKHRKEGHLYMVTEKLNNNLFLWNLTDASKFEFEEVNIPKELLDTATQGMVLKYTNGTYEYYSDDGFERSEKIHSSS